MLLVCCAGLLHAQTSGSTASFEVASVKRLAGPTGAIQHQIRPDGLSFRGVTLGYSLRWAYGLKPLQTYETNGPAWIDPPTDVRYEIVAKAAGAVSEADLRSMLQTLLAERFKLRLHRETRDVAVLSLVVAEGGHKLRNSEAVEGRIRPRGATQVLDCTGISMARLAEVLGPPWTTRPVVDETGLEGRFDFTLDITRYRQFESDGSPALEGGTVNMEAAVIRAVGPLGLKLAPRKAPVAVLVVDHAEKDPVQN